VKADEAGWERSGKWEGSGFGTTVFKVGEQWYGRGEDEDIEDYAIMG